MSIRSDVGLLYRRGGFGASAAKLEAAANAGFESTVDELLAGLSEPDRAHPPLPELTSFAKLQEGHGNSWEEHVKLIGWWLDKMAATTTPLREKLTLLLHDQFPTGFSKVGAPILMYRQNELFRNLGAGSFEKLTQAIAKDPAMLIWLDTVTDVRTAPNENFARELMERFTMGIGTYSQRDVEESARAFAGWSISLDGHFTITGWARDFGEKTFLGYSGDLDGEDIVHIVTRTAASAHWVVSRIWSWLSFPVGRHHPIVAELAPSYAADLNMTKLLRAIFMHPAFRSRQSYRGLNKQPIEWVAGIMRGLGLRSSSFAKVGGAGYLQWVLTNLGQIPFDPPTVGGWGANNYWLSTAASVAQLDFGQNVAQVADLSPLEKVGSRARLDLVGSMLGVESWSRASRTALSRVADQPPDLLTLALTAPEVLTN